jgi:serine/threonine-protein kinase RsbW
MPDVKFCLVFQRETLSVPVMRRVLGDTLRGLGMDEESVYDILLAATEACTNVLTHGGRKVRGYEVVTSLGAVGCQVEVADEGAGLAPGNPALSNPALSNPALSNPALSNPALSNPALSNPALSNSGRSNPVERGGPDPQQTPIAQLPESGRGLAVMRACVDNVTLDSRPGRGTVVTMRKRIRWPDDAPLRQLRAAS